MTRSSQAFCPSDNTSSMEDSIYSLRHRDILTFCVLGLLCLGIVMVQSASMRVNNNIHWQWTSQAIRHIVYAGVALAAFFCVGNLHHAAPWPRSR